MLRKTKGYFGMNSRYNFRGCVEDFIYKRFRCLTQSTVSRSFVEVPALNVFDHVIKPLTPQKSRIDTLKRQKDLASKNLKAERDRQRVAKAQQQIRAVTSNTILP